MKLQMLKILETANVLVISRASKIHKSHIIFGST